jgi:hypothetical protein
MTEDRRIHHPWIDSSRTPVYVLTFPEVVTDADLEACCAARERWAARARFPVTWVVDLTRIRTLTAKQRKTMAEHLGRFEPHDLAHNLGSAIVVPNAFLRGIVTAVFWLRAPKFPHQSFATPQEAIWWATSRHGASMSGSLGAGA